METDLTKRIKRRLHEFRPAFSSSMRTIRWAEEVQTPTGYVDVIRFEDYVERDDSFCAVLDMRSELPTNAFKRECKVPGETFPNKHCRGCFFKRNVHRMGILTTCFEVKITVSDFKSENGHNFHGNRNYYAVPVEIYDKVKDLVPQGIGIIVFYPDSAHMVVKRESEHREIGAETLSILLYDALKKWVDRTEETSHAEQQ